MQQGNPVFVNITADTLDIKFIFWIIKQKSN